MDKPDKMDPRRFIIIGTGGIGSRLAEDVCRLAQYRAPGSVVVLVDGDNFEPKNAERQMFDSLGNKAVVRARELQPKFPDVFIVADDRWVVDKIDDTLRPVGQDDDDDEQDGNTKMIEARELLDNGDIVFPTVDNFAARKAVFDAAREYDNIDVFTGGNDDALFVSTYHYSRKDGRDLTDHPADAGHEEYINPPDRNPGQLSCQERAEIEGGTQLLATNATAAAVLLARLQHVIIDGNDDDAAEIVAELGLGMMRGIDRKAENGALVTVGSANEQGSNLDG